MMTYKPLPMAPADKLQLHPQFSKYMSGKPIYPVNVEISPSGICSASCAFCFYSKGDLGNHRNVMLDKGVLVSALTQMAYLGVKSVSWTGGGDPSLHPDIALLIDSASNLGLQQGMFTNALARPKYNPGLMKWIRITITDKPVKPDYIKMLRPAKRLGIAFNYAGPQDYEALVEILKVAEDTGVDYVQLRPALKFHGQTVDIEPPNIQHPLLLITDYKFNEAKHRHEYTECEGYHFIPFIWEDGNVDVCAYMRNHVSYTLGNLYKNTFREIMDSAPKSMPVLPDCQVCCRNHEINKLIHRSRALEDKNFP